MVSHIITLFVGVLFGYFICALCSMSKVSDMEMEMHMLRKRLSEKDKNNT